MRFIRLTQQRLYIVHEQTSSHITEASRRIHTVIAKQDYTHADQALTDGFYEGFYSDGSLSSRVEGKTRGGRTGSPGEPGETSRTNSQQNTVNPYDITWDVAVYRHWSPRAYGPRVVTSRFVYSGLVYSRFVYGIKSKLKNLVPINQQHPSQRCHN